MAFPDDELRQKCGDVILVGGTFFLKGKLVFDNGVSFPVDVDLKISPRSGITFPKVKLVQRLQRDRSRPGSSPVATGQVGEKS